MPTFTCLAPFTMRDKLNILMVNYEFPPIGGGGGNANKYILRELAKNKELVIDLVTSSETSRDYIDRFSENITIHRLNVEKKRLHFWTQLEVLRFLSRSSKYVNKLKEERKYHLAHAFFGFPSGFITYINRKEIPYIVSLRGSDVPGFNKRFSIQYLFLSPLFKRIWRGAEAVVANSSDLKQLALETTPELPIDIIYNGIDTDEFFPEEKERKGTFNILCVSRLIPRKGVDYLIKALPEILQREDVRLVIAGEGNMETELKEKVSSLGLTDKVVFKGYVRHDDLPALYRDADVFVLPSLWEGMSNTVLEAISSGLPVIVTETGGTAELVKGIGEGRDKDGGNGIIIPKEDSDAISKAVLQLIDNKELSEEMGASSREMALKFSWGKVAEQYVLHYLRCMKMEVDGTYRE